MKHFVVFLLILAACDDGERVSPDTGSAYFPLRTGAYHIYEVAEARYSTGSEPVTVNYEIKTEVVDSFPSTTGRYTYVIYRSRRESDTAPWQPLDTWSAQKDDTRLIVFEGNTPFVRLTFPVAEGSRWNGNKFNALGEDEYWLASRGESLDLNGMTFENTATVVEEQNEDMIVFHDARREIYALGVGLVFREMVQLHYCTDDACLGQQIIDDGVEIKMELKEYGAY